MQQSREVILVFIFFIPTFAFSLCNLVHFSKRKQMLDQTLWNSLIKCKLCSCRGQGNECDQVCAICINSIDEAAKIGKIRKCGHTYHYQCLDGWLATHSICPVCRITVYLCVEDIAVMNLFVSKLMFPKRTKKKSNGASDLRGLKQQKKYDKLSETNWDEMKKGNLLLLCTRKHLDSLLGANSQLQFGRK